MTNRQRLSRKSKNKGYKGEKEVEKALSDTGVQVFRDGRSHKRDIYLWPHTAMEQVAEVKMRADGFKEIYKWIEGADLLFIRRDHDEWLVVMRMPKFKTWLHVIEQVRKRIMGG